MIAQPQPLARTCCCHVGPPPRPPPKGRPPGALVLAGPLVPPPGGRAPKPPNPAKPNCIITGTGPGALTGVLKVTWMLTEMSGSDELSTWPASCLVITGTSPFVSFFVLVTSQFTFGVSLGTRP